MDHPLSKRAADNLEDAAVSFIRSHLGIGPDSVSFRSGFAGEVSKHAFVKQQVVSNNQFMCCFLCLLSFLLKNGVPVANAVANVAFNDADKVVAFGSSFVKVPGKSLAIYLWSLS